jgi:predicted nucleic acid-binding protein
MPRVIISDTSPLRYLILIGQSELLPALYGEVLIPEAVANELKRPATPERVRSWVAHRPAWLQVVAVSAQEGCVSLPDLDPGEDDATGTVGILDRAAERCLIELAPVIAELRKTNFRIDPALLDRLLAADALRRKPKV